MPEVVMKTHPLFRVAGGLTLMGLLLSMPSCAALYFLGGKGEKDALYKLPKDQRVLVFVDASSSVNPTPGFTKMLGQKISDHLFKYKATDTLVAQSRLETLKSDPTFAKMGIADVARETGAEVMIYVNLITLNNTSTTDKSVAQGDAEVMVKVIGADGKHLYPPADVGGTPVQAQLDPAFTEGQVEGAVMNQLTDMLALRVGRMFHKYSLDDKELNQ